MSLFSKSFAALVLGAAALASMVNATALAASDKPRWSYSGSDGPDHWAALGDGKIYAACAGSEQSPVDLSGAVPADVEDIAIHWQPFQATVKNNGHSIEATAAPGQTTDFGGAVYNLLQVHWHHQSEHTIDGSHAPLEAHFVHQNPATGALMVLGVMMVEGEANPELQKIWDAIPAGAEAAAGDWSAMLPAERTIYRYAGSLTTPGCGEIVNWVVFKTPVTASRAQIDAFAALYPVNNRPLQPLGRRFVLLGQ
jgi:carbonic anhydrase